MPKWVTRVPVIINPSMHAYRATLVVFVEFVSTALRRTPVVIIIALQ